jgi:hypothetical protein
MFVGDATVALVEVCELVSKVFITQGMAKKERFYNAERPCRESEGNENLV